MTDYPWPQPPAPNPDAAISLGLLENASYLIAAEFHAARARERGATYDQVREAWVRYYERTAPHKMAGRR